MTSTPHSSQKFVFYKQGQWTFQFLPLILCHYFLSPLFPLEIPSAGWSNKEWNDDLTRFNHHPAYQTAETIRQRCKFENGSTFSSCFIPRTFFFISHGLVLTFNPSPHTRLSLTTSTQTEHWIPWVISLGEKKKTPHSLTHGRIKTCIVFERKAPCTLLMRRRVSRHAHTSYVQSFGAHMLFKEL